MHSVEGSQHRLTETAEETLSRRAESLAHETETEETSGRLSLLLFRIGEEWYAVPVGDVREIFQEYTLTRIPCVPDFILGVVNVRGEILSVTDSARIMGIGSIEMRENGLPPAIVVSDNNVTTALVVDEIGDIADVPSDALEPAISIIDRAQAEFIAGSVYIDGSLVGLISSERVLEPIVIGRH